MIFAGAGVSMGKPTNLPNFNNLTINIARGSGKTFDSSKDTPERFLGELEKENVPVQKLASNQLNEHNLQPNQYHKNIVELFPKNDIKIVTTNYDLMFEETCKELNVETNKYTNPAFPRGDNFSGIVHLHGKVGDFQHMVLTDSDFGGAYMLYGETSRFLSQLFNSDYTVLFIGYSYNDTVLRYFTRALPDLSGEKRYIFSDEKEKKSHEILGLTPIIYEAGDYESLYNIIKKTGDFSNRDSSSWDEIITEISLTKASKIDLTTIGEIEHIFSKKYLLEQFLNEIDGADWFYYLYENNYFDFLFNENDLLQSEALVMNWILNKFVNSDCEEIISILITHNTKVNSHYKNSLLRELSNKPVNSEALQKLLNLINLEEIDNYTIYSLIKKLSSYNNFNKVITNLFQEVLKFEYSFAKPYFGFEKNGYTVQVNVKTELIKKIWGFIEKREIHLESLTETITDELTNLENKSILGEVESNFSAYNSFLDETGYVDDKTYYIKFFINLLKRISATNSYYIEKWIQRYINSELSILRRISIYLINYLDNASAEDNLHFIKEKVGIFCFYEKEEVFSVVKTLFPKLTLEQQNKFIKYIMDYNFINKNNMEEQEFKRSFNYRKYNILVWLKRTDVKNEEIFNSIAEIKKIYPEFEERDYPDRNVGPIVRGFTNQDIKVTTKYFLENNLEDYFYDLLDYEGDGFEKLDRYTFLRIASKAIEEEFNLGLQFATKLLEMENYENDLWQYILQGFEKHVIDLNKFIQINHFLNSKTIQIFTVDVARILLKYSKNITKDEYNQFKSEICVLIETILEHSKPFEKSGNISCVDKALNTSYGIVTEAVVNFIILLNKNEPHYFIDDELKIYIDNIIDNKEAGEGHTILYIYLEHFNVFDSQWTDEKLIPNFSSEDEDKFNTSWQGYLYNTSFHPETCKKLNNAFLFAIKDVDRITYANFRDKFIRIYTLICIEVIEDPLIEFIPHLYYYSNEFVEEFYRNLVSTLENKDTINKENIWRKWLEKFILNRINNIPTYYNTEETNWILLILLKYDFLFDNVRKIIVEMEKKIKSPFNVFYELTEIDINDENNNTIQLILTFCLESIFSDNEEMIDSLSKELVEEILSNIRAKKYDLNEDLVEICSSLNIEIIYK